MLELAHFCHMKLDMQASLHAYVRMRAAYSQLYEKGLDGNRIDWRLSLLKHLYKSLYDADLPHKSYCFTRRHPNFFPVTPILT